MLRRAFGAGIVVSLVIHFAASAVWGVTLGKTADGRSFTIDGVPAFLNGISYYGNNSISTASFRTQDLDDMVARGINWVRAWVYWNWPWDTGPNYSAMSQNGTAWREPYHSRLITLITECNARGIIVDCTFERDVACNWAGQSPCTQSQHLAAVQKLATELLSYRNVYFDVANERDNSGVFVSFTDMAALINAVHAIDPGRLCTASQSGELAAQSDLADYINTGKVDFFSIHLCRNSTCPSLTYGTVQQYIGWMANIGKRVPIHLQEPFRRGIGSFSPVSEDYYRDETGAKIADAAGWCLHNGGQGSGRPYRSFQMADAEGRLFDQLDGVEQTTASGLLGQIGSTSINTRRYQVEYDEQMTHAIGSKSALNWQATVAADADGYMTTGPDVNDIGSGTHKVTYQLSIPDITTDNAVMAIIEVTSGSNILMNRSIKRQEFTAVNVMQSFIVNFISTGQTDLSWKLHWKDRVDMKCNWIQVNINGGTAETQATTDLGGSQPVNGLIHITTPADGTTSTITIGGRDCRTNTDPATDHYMYFKVCDGYAYQGNRPDQYFSFDYYDTGTGTLKVQYDSTSAAYTSTTTIALTGDNTWKTTPVWHVTDAYFGNRENSSTDFRISKGGGGSFYIDTVKVSVNP